MKTCFYRRVGKFRAAIADIMVMVGEHWITRINVPIGYRGQGIGSSLLDEILQEADQEGVKLTLQVNPSGGLSARQLIAWYGRRGFKSDPERPGIMIREAKVRVMTNV